MFLSSEEVYITLRDNIRDNWWKEPGLRCLNISIFLIFGSTAVGYDASLMNGLPALA